jgi:hypothetical protein
MSEKVRMMGFEIKKQRERAEESKSAIAKVLKKRGSREKKV